MRGPYNPGVCSWEAFIIPALAAVGGGSAAAGAGVIGSVAAAGASIGTSISKAQTPGSPKIVAPPSPVKAQEQVAAQRSRSIAGLSYRDTILSQSMGAGLKTRLGQ